MERGSVALSPEQITALARLPMSAIDLGKYLEQAQPDGSIGLRDFDGDFPLAK